MVSLARAIYSDTAADPCLLLEGGFATSDELEAHLLDEFIPSAFAGSVSRGPGRRRWTPRPDDAERWLTFLARHLSRQQTRDFEWWRLQNALPAPSAGWRQACSRGSRSAPLRDHRRTGAIWTEAAWEALGLMVGLALTAASLPTRVQAITESQLRIVLRRVGYTSAATVPFGLFLAFARIQGGIWLGIYDPVWYILLGQAAHKLGTAGIITRYPTTTPLHLHRRMRMLSRRLPYSLARALLDASLAALIVTISFEIAFCGILAVKLYPWPLSSVIYATSFYAEVVIACTFVPGALVGGPLRWLSLPADAMRRLARHQPCEPTGTRQCSAERRSCSWPCWPA